MKFRAAPLIASLIVAGMSLTACGGGREGTTAEATGSGSAAAGFAADATVGVALPWLGTQNWKEAETMFEDQLTEAGFKPLIQAADNKVPQQQQQIEAMIEQGHAGGSPGRVSPPSKAIDQARRFASGLAWGVDEQDRCEVHQNCSPGQVPGAACAAGSMRCLRSRIALFQALNARRPPHWAAFSSGGVKEGIPRPACTKVPKTGVT